MARGRSGCNRAGTFRELSPQDWTPACDVAFVESERALVQSVVLAHPDFERPFILCTDASLDGLGAVLSQVPTGEDKARPITFASKSLSRSQANYPAHRLEFLALKCPGSPSVTSSVTGLKAMSSLYGLTTIHSRIL